MRRQSLSSKDGSYFFNKVKNDKPPYYQGLEYTDWTPCRGVRYPAKRCPGYDTKQSDGEASVMFWWMWSSPFIIITPRSTLALNGSTW